MQTGKDAGSYTQIVELVADFYFLKCKASRIKCDEAKPACTRCTRSGKACAYVDSPSRSACHVRPASTAPKVLLPRIRTHGVADPSDRQCNIRVSLGGIGPLPSLLRYASPHLPGRSHQLLYECTVFTSQMHTWKNRELTFWQSAKQK
jgi:hypothetical protein